MNHYLWWTKDDPIIIFLLDATYSKYKYDFEVLEGWYNSIEFE